MRRLMLLAVAAGVTACELTEITLAEPEPLLVVEMILRTGQSPQYALVHTSVGGDAGVFDDITLAFSVQGGPASTMERVAETACLDDVSSREAEATACFVTSDELPALRPGTTYRLHVTGPGIDFAGSTTVPGVHDMVSPIDSVCWTPAGRTVPVVWHPSSDAWAYLGAARISGLRRALALDGVEVPEPLDLTGLAVGAQDTTLVVPSDFGLFDRFDTDLTPILIAIREGLPPDVVAEVLIAAADRNYVNWVRGGTFNPSGAVRTPSLNGRGGTGVLGSVTSRQRSIISLDYTPPTLPRC